MKTGPSVSNAFMKNVKNYFKAPANFLKKGRAYSRGAVKVSTTPEPIEEGSFEDYHEYQQNIVEPEPAVQPKVFAMNVAKPQMKPVVHHPGHVHHHHHHHHNHPAVQSSLGVMSTYDEDENYDDDYESLASEEEAEQIVSQEEYEQEYEMEKHRPIVQNYQQPMKVVPQIDARLLPWNQQARQQQQQLQQQQQQQQMVPLEAMPQRSIEHCLQIVDPGSCRTQSVRYYYDQTLDVCKPFVWTGCGGNANNFRTQSECEIDCKGAVSKPALGGILLEEDVAEGKQDIMKSHGDQESSIMHDTEKHLTPPIERLNKA